MGSRWNDIKNIFEEKYKKKTVAAFIKQKFKFRGDELGCWACDFPIHLTHKTRRWNGKLVHTRCAKKLNRIINIGDDVNAF